MRNARTPIRATLVILVLWGPGSCRTPDTVAGDCEPACGAGSACIDKTCQKLCIVDGECGEGQVCRTGLCKVATGEIACGNDSLDPGEVCDGFFLGGQSCVTQGFSQGALACTANCDGLVTTFCFNTGADCGNDTREFPEVCDGSDVGTYDCEALAFDGGTLACAGSCDAFVTTGCSGSGPTCGDGAAEGIEVCDDVDFRGETCVSQGYDSGTLTCSNCTALDFADCVGTGPVCGDAEKVGSEVCDGADVGGNTCMDLGFSAGELACAGNCTAYDTSNCASGPFCGNVRAEGSEVCDGSDVAGEDCASQGYDAGTLGCATDCTAFDFAGCYTIPAGCGDDTLAAAEACDGDDLAGKDCVSEGFDAGVLACRPDCGGFDTSACGAANGEPCSEDEDCAGGRCLEYSGSAITFAEGYCSEECYDLNCEFGGQCLGSTCFAPCAEHDDCRDGYGCNDRYGKKVCLPRCPDDFRCLDASQSRCDTTKGSCAPCVVDDDCAHLPEPMCEAGVCVQCRSPSDCTGAQACRGKTCYGGAFGEQCVNGQSCLSGFCLRPNWLTNSSGLCSQGCDGDDACPTGAVCDADLKACVVACTDSDGCPSGFFCGHGPAEYTDDQMRCLPPCAAGDTGATCMSRHGARCDTTTGLCSPCLVDADCALPGLFLDAGICADGVCVQCLASADCRASQMCITGECQGLVSIGGPCEKPGDCEADWCLSDWPGGYCAGYCSGTKACPEGAVCDGGTCRTACATDTDCRAGYVCADGSWHNPNGITACVPACTDGGDCAPERPVCTDGRCVPCAAQADCAAHAESGFSVCADGRCVQCVLSADCGSDEYCVGDFCAGPVGTACHEGSECLTNSCYQNNVVAFPGGYCSRSCDKHYNCPGGARCDLDLDFCLAACSEQSDCREGYVCADNDVDGQSECRAACQQDWDCPLAVAVCDSATGICGACASDDDCQHFSSTPRCFGGACVECLDLTDCGPAQTCQDRQCRGTLANGAACADADVCAGGRCETERWYWSGGGEGTLLIFPGGYCTGYCSDTCAAGSHCVANIGFCFRSCNTGGDCRAGYSCLDFDANGESECVPQCVNNEQCRSPNAARCDFASGQCAPCLADMECPGEELCQAGLCVECIDTSDCESSLQICNLDKECVGLSPNAGPCAESRDCSTGHCQTEQEGYAGGFCYRWCGSNSDCVNGGGVCEENRCAQPCSINSDCRDGYICDDVAGGELVCARACRGHFDCSRAAPRCNIDTGECLPCETDGECQRWNQVCESGECVECIDDQDCGADQICDDNRCRGTLPTGSACYSSSICSGESCRKENSGMNFVDGYCSESCWDGDCAGGGHCFLGPSRYCVADCTGVGDCREGYLCADLDSDGANECLPACVDNNHCQYGDASQCDTATGLCEACESDEACQHLSDFEVCISGVCWPCRVAEDCGDHQICNPGNQCEGVLENGEACAGSDVCASGNCRRSHHGFPGGYCSQSCDHDSDCAHGGHCADNYGICLHLCADVGECRPGYLCEDVDASGSKVCVPACTSDSFCTKAGASRCDDASGLCAPCEDNAECGHLGDKKVCDGGLCVECLADEDCGTHRACELGTRSCYGTQENGEACEAWNECRSNSCRYDYDGYPGGYCREWCNSDFHCDYGGHCPQGGHNFCMVECADIGECRSGYLCEDLDENGVKECFPACTSNDVCISAGASRCEVSTGLCGPCQGDPDCDHLHNREVCVSEVCVECRDHGDCGANRECDTTSHECYGTLDNGAGCNNWDECRAEYSCNSPSNGFPGGFCVQWCDSHDDCSAGGHCVMTKNYCAISCTDNAECRSGYICVDLDADTDKECVPACTENAFCTASDASLCDLDTGLCGPCAEDADCAHFSARNTCEGGICVECRENDDCGQNQLCNVAANDCYGTLPNGAACESRDECEAEYDCYSEGNGYPGGFCRQWCNDDADCTAGGQCVMTRNLCAVACTDNAECRAGYLCDNWDANSVKECVPACVNNQICSTPASSRCDVDSGLCGPCATNADCAHFYRDKVCYGGTCVECTAIEDCGLNQVCNPLVNQCQGTLANGEACGHPEECQAEWNCYSASNGFPGGYCAQWCHDDANCTAGGHCADGNNYCMPDCTDHTDCRAGYLCLDEDNDCRKECSIGIDPGLSFAGEIVAGPIDVTATGVESVSVGAFGDGRAAVVYRDSAAGSPGMLAVYDGCADVPLFDPPKEFDTTINFSSTVALPNGNIAIAYQDSSDGQKCKLVKYDSAGTGLLAPTELAPFCEYPAAASFGSGAVLVAYAAGDPSYVILDPTNSAGSPNPLAVGQAANDFGAATLANGNVFAVHVEERNPGVGDARRWVAKDTGELVHSPVSFANDVPFAGSETVATTRVGATNVLVAYVDGTSAAVFVIFDESPAIVAGPLPLDANASAIAAITTADGTALVAYKTAQDGKGRFKVVNENGATLLGPIPFADQGVDGRVAAARLASGLVIIGYAERASGGAPNPLKIIFVR